MAEPISKERVAQAVYDGVIQAALNLRPDMHAALIAARERAQSGTREAGVLDMLLDNADIARTDGVPLCQDTGTVRVCLEVGESRILRGDVFADVDKAVERAYTDSRLRMSVLRDALVDRTNTATNAPAFCEIKTVPGDGAVVHVMLKGGGSDNASRVAMLAPGVGREGVIAEILSCVREKAANACPPLVIGIGVGSTFDKVAGLAKQALMRPIGQPSADARVARFEEEVLQAVNATGIGAGALGGDATAVSVAVETAPCHIAALPIAVNLGCSAMRSATVDLDTGAMVGCEEGCDMRACPSNGSQADARQARRLNLPIDSESLSDLAAGDPVLLSGPVYTMRDAGHMRTLEHLKENGALPFGLEGQTLFYAGPTPSAAGRPLGSVGPTTSSRMDFATPAMMDAGIVATIGKGKRSEAVRDACMRNGGVYFAAVGGAAALLAKHVVASEDVAWPDLGTEALRRLELEDFPVYVAINTHGNDLYRGVEEAAETRF